METKQWTMQEDFIFPEHAGLPNELLSVKVTPGFTEERTEDGVLLTGIYHIAAEISFAEGERDSVIPENAVLIDDVDLEGGAGYFEYAVPLNINLPPEVKSPLQVVAKNPTADSDGQGLFGVTWTVECSYQDELVQENVAEPLIEVVEQIELKEEIVLEHEQEEKVVLETELKEKVVLETELEEKVVLEQEPEVTVAVANIKHTSIVASNNDSTSFNDADEALSFIAGLEDGVSTTVYRSNDVFVKNEG